MDKFFDKYFSYVLTALILSMPIGTIVRVIFSN